MDTTAGAGDEIADLLEGGAFLFHRDDFGADRVPGDARGVAHGAEDQLGLALVIGDDSFLDALMDRALLGAHEARDHVASAPSASAATRPRASPKPPEAIIGIFTLSAATGIRISPGVSSSPGWPAHSKPSIEIASTPMRSAESAWRTLVP